MKRALPSLRAPSAVAFGLLAAFTLVSVLGYWNFALHPERLPNSPGALKFFSISFKFFAQLHIVVAALALGVVLVRSLGWRWWPALVGVYAVSFFSEHMGTGYGIPFGGYSYTALLGMKLGGRVPALIPLSWFLMAVPSFVLARAATGADAPWPLRLALGAFWLTVWDLALDPAMSYLTPYWIWEESGPYYGMPWVNLLGWFVTGLALMGVLEGVASRTGLLELPVRWMAAYYALVLALPMGMVLAGGLWTAAGVTVLGVAAATGLSLLAARAGSASHGHTEVSPVGAR